MIAIIWVIVSAVRCLALGSASPCRFAIILSVCYHTRGYGRGRGGGGGLYGRIGLTPPNEFPAGDAITAAANIKINANIPKMLFIFDFDFTLYSRLDYEAVEVETVLSCSK